jgi:hypothetical protein
MKARFFCDSCGASVGARADRCPACGKTFAAVRCPQCGYEGRPSEFMQGCKVCGYMAEPGGKEKRPAPARSRPGLPISPWVARVAAGGLLLLLAVFVVMIVAR